MIAAHLLAQEGLAHDAFIDAFAQQPEEERLLARIGMGLVPAGKEPPSQDAAIDVLQLQTRA